FDAAFAEAPNAAFTINGVSPGQSAFTIGASLRGRRASGLSYELSYDAEFWNNATEQLFHGRISYSFQEPTRRRRPRHPVQAHQGAFCPAESHPPDRVPSGRGVNVQKKQSLNIDV